MAALIGELAGTAMTALLRPIALWLAAVVALALVSGVAGRLVIVVEDLAHRIGSAQHLTALAAAAYGTTETAEEAR